MSELTPEQIKDQSRRAISQWGDKWLKHCEYVKEKFPNDVKTSLDDYMNSGIGKAVLLIANGYSFEENIETIKKYQENVDIMVCDKTLGHCLDNGIIPDFCLVCDANVNYERYMEKWKDKLQDTVVFQNVCANPKWVDNGNWKKRVFFVNKDVLNSEKKWMELSGCSNTVAAGTNVSNAMVVFMTQCDNDGRKNFFGYDKILLIGFDYSWQWDKKYYAFDELGDGKSNYMRHVNAKNQEGQHCYSSNNLVFSSKWIDQYVKTFKLPVVQCTKKTILSLKHVGNLEEQMQYSYKKEDAKEIKNLYNSRMELMNKLKGVNKRLNEISKDHYFSFLAST